LEIRVVILRDQTHVLTDHHSLKHLAEPALANARLAPARSHGRDGRTTAPTVALIVESAPRNRPTEGAVPRQMAYATASANTLQTARAGQPPAWKVRFLRRVVAGNRRYLGAMVDPAEG